MMTDVWSVAEICTSIMVVSLPALRPLLRKGQTIFTGTSRRTPQHVLPIQEPPTSPRSPSIVRPQSIFSRSKTDPATRRNGPPEGYSYSYETRSIDGSHVELHGALSNEINQAKDGSRVQTIAVYTDAKDVIERISEEERRKAASEGSITKEQEDLEQQKQQQQLQAPQKPKQ
jgi:hypothetical protein